MITSLRSRLRFAAVVAVLAALVVLMTAPGAWALTKVRSDVPLVTDPIVFEGFCSFPVEYQDLSGQLTQTLTFDDEGNLVQINVRGHLVSTFTANGQTLTYSNSGSLTVVPQPDGTDLVTLNGRNWNADQGLITDEPFMATAIGHVVIVSVFNPDTGFNDFFFIELSGISTDICAALAP
jgi:hypothetical protein